MERILVIGGTQFVGRNLVEALIKNPNYDLTLFNRGKTNAHLFPKVKRIIGDREVFSDLDKIAQQDWDFIFDISSYFPLSLNYLLDQLEGKVGRYIYVSTSSHYQFDQNIKALTDENCPLIPCSEAQMVDTEPSSYNQRKAACERVLQSKTWLDKIILRPALIIGQYDVTDRLYYWFYKVQKRFAFLLPNGGQYQLAFTNVADFTQMLVESMTVKNRYEVYNASSFIASIGVFVKGAMYHLKKRPNLIDVDVPFLERNEVARWTGLPLWVDADVMKIDNSRLVQDYAISLSSLDQTIFQLIDYYENTLHWRPPGAEIGNYSALSLERENQLIQLFQLGTTDG